MSLPDLCRTAAPSFAAMGLNPPAYDQGRDAIVIGGPRGALVVVSRQLLDYSTDQLQTLCDLGDAVARTLLGIRP